MRDNFKRGSNVSETQTTTEAADVANSGSSHCSADRLLRNLAKTFERFTNLQLPPEVAEAMLRVKEYKDGRTVAEVFGPSGREGYRDDCKIIAEYFVSRIVC